MGSVPRRRVGVDGRAAPPATSAVWADNGEAQLAVTQAGTYELIGTDNQGCPASGAVDVTDAPGPELELLVDPNLVVCGGTEAELAALPPPAPPWLGTAWKA